MSFRTVKHALAAAAAAAALTPTAWASRDETIADDAYFLNLNGRKYQQKANTGPGGSRLMHADMAALGCVPRYYFDGTALPSAVSGDWTETASGTGTVTIAGGYIKMYHPAVLDDAYCSWLAHGQTAATNWYIRCQLKYSYIAADVALHAPPWFVIWDGVKKMKIHWGNAGSTIDNDIAGTVFRKTYAVTTERLLEMVIVQDTLGPSHVAWIDGEFAPLFLEPVANYTASAAAQIKFGVQSSATGGRGTTEIKELLVCHD